MFRYNSYLPMLLTFLIGMICFCKEMEEFVDDDHTGVLKDVKAKVFDVFFCLLAKECL